MTDEKIDPWPLDREPIFANPFFRDYILNPNHKRKRVYDPDEVFAIVEQTPEELKMLEGTKKLDANDLTNEELDKFLNWAYKNAPCVYVSNSKRETLGELESACPDRRPYIIDQLLRRGEVANLISASKVGKTFMTIQLALTVAVGGKLFDKFQCDQGKVLVVDNELHREELPWRYSQVAHAMMIPMDYLRTTIDFISLRGRLTDLEGLWDEISDVTPSEYKLVVLDSLYRMMPPRTDENDNGSMARLYNTLDRFAAYCDAPIVVVHHASKGSQAGKNVVDVGAGAGAQSRACDLHIVLRPLEQDNCVVMEAAARSSPRSEPLPLRFEFPKWRVDDSLDVTQLKGATQAQSKDPASIAEARRSEKVKTEFIARNALLGTTMYPPALTDQLQTNDEIREKIKGPPWNMDIGHRNMDSALHMLRNEHIAVCHRRPPSREFAWQFAPNKDEAIAKAVAARMSAQPVAQAPADPQPLSPEPTQPEPAAPEQPDVPAVFNDDPPAEPDDGELPI